MRASRATELAEQFPGHVAAQWLGHSETIADRHYRQVLPEHFDKALRTEIVMPKVMSLDAVSSRTGSHDENEHLSQVVSVQEKTAACENMQPSDLDDTGLEFDAKTPCFSGAPQNVVLPVVLKLLESPVFCEMVELWSVLDLEQQQLVFDAVREQARQPR